MRNIKMRNCSLLFILLCISIPSAIHAQLAGREGDTDSRFSGSIPQSSNHLDHLKIPDQPNNSSLLTRLRKLLSSPATPHSDSGLAIPIITNVTAGALGFVTAFFFLRWSFTMSKKSSDADMAEAGTVTLFEKPIVPLTIRKLVEATRGFDPNRIIMAGSTRIGTCYKAVLPDGSELAVKCLESCSVSKKLFCSEMVRLGQLRHPNLVPLLGFFVVEDQHLLIYKHMLNGSLSDVLHSQPSLLDWPTRLKIAIGAARGLAWLHHGFRIPKVHQSISSFSILLDIDCEARIADSGLARLARPSLVADTDTDPSPFLNGEFGQTGYVAPEYTEDRIPTPQVDAYAFGMVMLELATGKEATEAMEDEEELDFKWNLMDWVNRLLETGRISNAIDSSLRGKGHDEQIFQFLEVAVACVAMCPEERFSMHRVYRSLMAIGGERRHLEYFDEFPLIYRLDEAGTSRLL